MASERPRAAIPLKAFFILCACLLGWASTAWGHAALVASDPAAGAVLDQAPAAIVLRFSEPVSATTLRLFDPAGRPRATGAALAQGTRLRIPLTGTPQPGTWLLSWRVVSADGHPVGGTLAYAVGAPDARGTPVTQTSAPARNGAIWLARWLGFLCLFAASGAALLHDPVTGVRNQRWAWPAIGAGLLLLPIDLGLQGLDLRDAPWTALGERATWALALASTYALSLALLGLAYLAAAAALRAQHAGVRRGAAMTALILPGLALVTSGHAATASPRWLSHPLVILHGITAIAWLGALIPLTRLLRSDPGPASDLAPLAAFSRRIPRDLALLAASGLGLALLQMNAWGDLWRTPYGLVLSVKLLLVAVLLMLGALNRVWLTRPTLAGDPVARQRLRRSISVEVLVAALVLAVLSLWRFTPPPRSQPPVSPAAAAAPLILRGNQAWAHIDRPAGAGLWTIRLASTTADPLPAQGVTLLLDNPASGIEPLRRAAHRLADGRWQAEMPALPGIGHWQVRLEILIDDFAEIWLGP